MISDAVIAKGNKLPTLEVNKENWMDIVNTAREYIKPIDGELSPLMAMKHYSICPKGVLTTETLQLLEVFKMFNGVSRLNSPLDYYELDNKYVEACQVIDEEIIRLDKINGNSKRKS